MQDDENNTTTAFRSTFIRVQWKTRKSIFDFLEFYAFDSNKWGNSSFEKQIVPWNVSYVSD